MLWRPGKLRHRSPGDVALATPSLPGVVPSRETTASAGLRCYIRPRPSFPHAGRATRAAIAASSGHAEEVGEMPEGTVAGNT
jgi:hypothetical protein